MRIALFATCLADTLYPQVARATVAVLERLELDVSFPRAQTCCGQLHWNAGYPDEARALAERFAGVFAGYDAVVSPSGSCVAHVRAHVPELADAGDVAARTWELSQFLVDRLGVEDVGSGFSGTRHVPPDLSLAAAPPRRRRAACGCCARCRGSSCASCPRRRSAAGSAARSP